MCNHEDDLITAHTKMGQRRKESAVGVLLCKGCHYQTKDIKQVNPVEHNGKVEIRQITSFCAMKCIKKIDSNVF